MSVAISRQVGLGCIRKDAKCEPRSKLVSKIPPGFLVQALALSS